MVFPYTNYMYKKKKKTNRWFSGIYLLSPFNNRTVIIFYRASAIPCTHVTRELQSPGLNKGNTIFLIKNSLYSST